MSEIKSGKSLPEIGALVKVHLFGESPWAECLATNPDGTWLGRLDNHLVNTGKHDLKFNDTCRFAYKSIDDFTIWVPQQDIEPLPERALRLRSQEKL